MIFSYFYVIHDNMVHVVITAILYTALYIICTN